MRRERGSARASRLRNSCLKARTPASRAGAEDSKKLVRPRAISFRSVAAHRVQTRISGVRMRGGAASMGFGLSAAHGCPRAAPGRRRRGRRPLPRLIRFSRTSRWRMYGLAVQILHRQREQVTDGLWASSVPVRRRARLRMGRSTLRAGSIADRVVIQTWLRRYRSGRARARHPAFASGSEVPNTQVPMFMHMPPPLRHATNISHSPIEGRARRVHGIHTSLCMSDRLALRRARPRVHPRNYVEVVLSRGRNSGYRGDKPPLVLPGAAAADGGF